MKAQPTVTTLSALHLLPRQAGALLSEGDIPFFVNEHRVLLGAQFFQAPCAMLDLEDLMEECPSVKETLHNHPPP